MIFTLCTIIFVKTKLQKPEPNRVTNSPNHVMIFFELQSIILSQFQYDIFILLETLRGLPILSKRGLLLSW